MNGLGGVGPAVGVFYKRVKPVLSSASGRRDHEVVGLLVGRNVELRRSCCGAPGEDNFPVDVPFKVL